MQWMNKAMRRKGLRLPADNSGYSSTVSLR